MSLERWSARWLRVLAYGLGMLFWTGVAHAGNTSGGSLPFVDAIRTIHDDVTGPVATMLLFIVVALALVAWAFFERNEKVIHVLKAIVAASLIFGGFTVFSSLGIAGAVV